jgi:hypothetical protein
MKKLILYTPRKIDYDRISDLRNMLKREAQILGLYYEEKVNPEDYLMIYYKDKEVSTFLYVEDDPNESIENIRVMIRVLALIAMTEEKELEKGIREEAMSIS